jgi:hypothetical protein
MSLSRIIIIMFIRSGMTSKKQDQQKDFNRAPESENGAKGEMLLVLSL